MSKGLKKQRGALIQINELDEKYIIKGLALLIKSYSNSITSNAENIKNEGKTYQSEIISFDHDSKELREIIGTLDLFIYEN